MTTTLTALGLVIMLSQPTPDDPNSDSAMPSVSPSEAETEQPESEVPGIEVAPSLREDDTEPKEATNAAEAATIEQAAEHPCAGQSVYSVRLIGCQGSACDVGQMRTDFVSLTDIEVNPDRPQVLSTADIERAERRLMATGFFRELSIDCVPHGDSSDVIIAVKPHTFVRKVKLEGNRFFRTSEITKRVTLHAGDPLNIEDGVIDDNETIRRVIESMRSLYLKSGFNSVNFATTVTQIDPFTGDVLFTIEEGQRERIASIEVLHHAMPEDAAAPVRCPAIDLETVQDLIDINTGQVVTQREIRRVRSKVKKWFQSIGFERPTVTVRVEGDPLIFKLDVTTERCWLVRVWQRNTGISNETSSAPAFRFRDPIEVNTTQARSRPYTRVNLEDWRELLPFAESGVFEQGEALRGMETIKDVLESRGYFFAEVNLEYRPLQTRRRRSDNAKPLAGTIDYYLTLNHSRRLQGISFPGRRAFDEETLDELMATKVYDFLGEPGHLQVDTILFDLTKIKRHYQGQGFFDFRYAIQGEPQQVGPSYTRRSEGPWLIWEYRYRDRGFLLKKRRGEMVLYLEVPVVEGPRTRVRKITSIGHEVLDNKAVGKLLGLKAGDDFGDAVLQQGLDQLRGWYIDEGYHRVQVSAQCDGLKDTISSGDCSVAQIRSEQVELVIRVDEGPKSVVGEVFWRGNFKTQAEILTRDLPLPDTPYRQSQVQEAARQMRNLGIFTSVRIEPIGLDEDPPRDKIALVVSVEEGQTTYLDFALGFRTIDRDNAANNKAPAFIGSIISEITATTDRSTTGLGRRNALSLPDVLLKLEVQFIEHNLFGLGWQFKLPLTYALSTTDYLRIGSITPTLNFIRPGGSNLDIEVKATAEIDRATDQLDRTEFGIYSGLTWPIIRAMPLTFGLDFGVICFRNPDAADPWCSIDDYSPQFRPSIRWRWDTQDNPLNPSKGFMLSAEFKYIFGQSRDELLTLDIDESVGSELSNFLKWEASAEFAIGTPIGLIIAGLMRYGGSFQIGGDGAALLPSNEVFTLGGSNGLRGFADHAVGRYDRSGQLDQGSVDIAGNRSGVISDYREDGGGNVIINGSLELRMPVLRDRGVWLAGFLDGGALGRRHTDIHPESFRFSAGVGLRYLIGGQIPIRLDWGAVLGKLRCLEYDPQAALSTETLTDADCGTREDGHRIHFDLLYPF